MTLARILVSLFHVTIEFGGFTVAIVIVPGSNKGLGPFEPWLFYIQDN